MTINRLFLFVAAIFAAASSLFAQDQWQQLGWPEGAHVIEVVQLGDTIVAVDEASRFWVSVDGGGDWKQEGSRGYVYSAFGRIWNMARSSDSLFYLHQGTQWVYAATLPQQLSRTPVIFEKDSLFVRGEKRVYVSTDPGGRQWTRLGHSLPDGFGNRISAIGLGRSDGQRIMLCAVADSGVFRLQMSGNWKLVSNDDRLKRLTHVAHSGRAYLAVTDEGHAGVLLESTDGISWDSVRLGDSRSVRDLAIDGASVFAATERGLYVSADSGKTWTLDPLREPGVHVADIHLNGARITLGTYPLGVYASTDRGATWSQSSVATLDPVVIREHRREMLAGCTPYPWTNVNGHFNGLDSWFRRDGDTWHLVPVPPSIYKPPWSRTDPDLYSYHDVLFYSHWDIAAGTYTLSRSSDDGMHWQQYDTGDTFFIAPFAEDDRHLFLFSSVHNPKVRSNLAIGRTADTGSSWQVREIRPSDELHGHLVDLAAIPGHLYALGSCWFAHSTDAGDTWAGDTARSVPWFSDYGGLVVTDSLVCIYGARELMFVKRHADTTFEFQRSSEQFVSPLFGIGMYIMFCDREGNIHRRHPGTGEWERWKAGPIPGASAEFAGFIGETVYIRSGGNIWSMVLSKVTAAEPLPALPALALDTWPQPARDALNVRVRGGGAETTLILTDLLGRELRRLRTGNGRAVIPVSSLPRGMYILHAESGGKRIFRSVLR